MAKLLPIPKGFEPYARAAKGLGVPKDQFENFIRGGAEAMAGVASGGIDMGTFGTPILIGIAAGLPIKIVGSPPQKRQSFELVARKGINSVKELKGKVVTSGALGGGSHESLLKILHDNGLTENDVGVVATGGTDTALDHNPELAPGDTVQVSRAGLVFVVGDVQRPGGFPVDPAQGLTVVQAQYIVGLGEIDPESVVTPGIYVDRVVHCPYAA